LQIPYWFNAFVVSIVCRTGRVRGAINRDLRVFVSDSSKTTSPVNIRGTATSDNDSFAYKVRKKGSYAAWRIDRLLRIERTSLSFCF